MTKEKFQKLGFMFANGFRVHKGQGDDEVETGRGLYLTDLERWGFTKKEMKELVAKGVVREVMTQRESNPGLRKTYILDGAVNHYAPGTGPDAP